MTAGATDDGTRRFAHAGDRLDEDPTGYHVVMTDRGTLLGTVVGSFESEGGDRLEVRFFNGEPWPDNPLASEVTVLVREHVREYVEE